MDIWISRTFQWSQHEMPDARHIVKQHLEAEAEYMKQTVAFLQKKIPMLKKQIAVAQAKLNNTIY